MESAAVEEILNRIKSNPELTPVEFQNQIRKFVHSAQEDSSGGKRFTRFSKSIINQQLPQDLEKFFFQSNLPAEALNTATELTKSGQKIAKDSEKDLVLKITKLLVERWMSRNCCAETFVRFCIGSSGLAETTNFSRNLFSVADNFQLNHQEFPRFVFQQVLLAVSVLSRLIRAEEANYEVRTCTLSSALDRLFLRLFIEEERFYPYFDSEGEILLDFSTDGMKELDPFQHFILVATELSEEDFIARRLLGKILLGLGLNPGSKITRIIFLVEGATKGGSPATRMLYPPQDFVRTNQVWNRNLTTTIPLKSRVASFKFFTPWAQFLTQEMSAADLFSLWKTLSSSWTQLLSATSSDSKTITSVTCALIALAKSFKLHRQQIIESLRIDSGTLSITSVFQGVQKCLGSTDPIRQGCGMALGQVMSDLVTIFLNQNSAPTPQPENTGNIENPNSEEPNSRDKLKFESDNPYFLKYTAYYENQQTQEMLPVPRSKDLVARNFYTSFQNLDSDDDDDEDATAPQVDEDDVESEFQPYDMSNDTPVNESILNLHSIGKKIPNYFSEICEVLMEAHGNKDEAAMEVLKRISVMKIPVLLFHKICIEPTVARDLTRVLSELEGNGILEMPIVCALFELANLYPDSVFPTMGQIAFDKDHHSAGHRMVVLARYSEVVQLLSRQKCFSCFSEKTGKLAKILENIHPPFIKEYLQKKQLLTKCKQCGKMDGKILPPDKAPSEPEKELDRALTWREVIERRVAAKTRRFASSSKGKETVEIVDVYSATLVPIIWASLANKLGDCDRFLSNDHAQFLSSALFIAQIFRTLGLVVLGTAGIMCPHFRNLATQTADLVSSYSFHQDAQVRRSVLSLLAMIITSSEGKQYILEIFLGKNNLFEELKTIFEKDPDTENRRLFSSLYQLVSASALVQMGHLISN